MNEDKLVAKTYWQVTAGSDDREYSQDFLHYGMAFVGGKIQISTMDRVKKDDIIILRGGMKEVVAVGKIVERDGKFKGNGDKIWLRDFDGWDLSAYCYVEWHKPKKNIQTYGLTRATIQAVHQSHLKKLAEDIVAKFPPLQIYAEPKPTKKVEDGEILEFLIRKGFRPAAAEDLTNAFRRIRLLADYYFNECEWEDIREHETRTFLILPLLLALGWAEQQIKIELGVVGKRIDIACFGTPYQKDSKNCVLILESKGFRQGLDYAPEQAKEYAKSLPSCKIIVVSNGYSYKAYVRDERDSSMWKPYAYLNLRNPQDRYPRNPQGVKGCLDLLQHLMPSH
jgi:hypothetical protein